MIRVHAYCSYKLSPSGFQYGTFDITDDANEGMYNLSDENKDAIISSAFDYSIVKRLKGKIPKKSTFVFLFKKVSYTYDSEHDDVGGDVSLNMAFEFDDYKQFVLFSNGFESYEKNEPLELAKILADCIAPDISITKYKLSIHKKNFDDWLRLMIDNQQDIETDQSRLQWQLGIITDSNEKNLYSNDLQEIFNFDTITENGDEVGIKHLEGAMYIYPSKKREIPQEPVTSARSEVQSIIKDISSGFNRWLSRRIDDSNNSKKINLTLTTVVLLLKLWKQKLILLQ